MALLHAVCSDNPQLQAHLSAAVRVQLGQWDRHMNALQPAVRDKLKLMCQLQ